MNPLRGKDGRVLYWFGTSADINEQKHSEETSRYLAKVSGVLAGVVDYESTLQKVANLSVPYFADWSSVDVTDEDGSLRRLAVAHQHAQNMEMMGDPPRVALGRRFSSRCPFRDAYRRS